MKLLLIPTILMLSSCGSVHLSKEAQENQCLEYGHEKGTPAYGECMQKEREMANDFLWGDG